MIVKFWNRNTYFSINRGNGKGTHNIGQREPKMEESSSLLDVDLHNEWKLTLNYNTGIFYSVWTWSVNINETSFLLSVNFLVSRNHPMCSGYKHSNTERLDFYLKNIDRGKLKFNTGIRSCIYILVVQIDDVTYSLHVGIQKSLSSMSDKFLFFTILELLWTFTDECCCQLKRVSWFDCLRAIN